MIMRLIATKDIDR